MKMMFDGEAVCRSELGAHQMQGGWQEISEITWMGDICLGSGRWQWDHLFTLPPSRLIKYETKKLHFIWLCGLRSHLDIQNSSNNIALPAQVNLTITSEGNIEEAVYLLPLDTMCHRLAQM